MLNEVVSDKARKFVSKPALVDMYTVFPKENGLKGLSKGISPKK